MANGKVVIRTNEDAQRFGMYIDSDILTGKKVLRRIGGAMEDGNGNNEAEEQ